MSRNGKKDSAELDTSELPSLPKGWCWTTVGEIGEVRLGRQRSPKNRSDKYPTKYVRAANITWRGLRLDDVMDMDFSPSERTSYSLQPGDILLSEASGSADEVGKPAIWNGELPECCFQNTVIRFRPRCLPPDFPFVVFCHFARNKVFAQVAKGIGIHHLGADRFAQIPFPLPPAAEQSRIKAKVDELFSDLDAGVAALERVRANLKRYRAAVLKAAVEGRLTAEWREKNPPKETGPQLLARILAERRSKWEQEQLAAFAKAGKTPPAKWKDKYKEPTRPDCTGLPPLPKGWCWATLESVLREPLRNGHSAKASANGKGVRTLTLTAVTYGDFSEANVKYTTANPLHVEDLWIEPGDILIERSNTPELVGTARLFQGPSRFAIFPDLLIRIRAVPSVSARFCEVFLQSYIARRYFQSRAKGLAGSMPKIDQGTILRCPLPLPPLEEQERISAVVAQGLSIVAATEGLASVSQARAARLRQAILKRAFKGRLVPQDPADEPAGALLERIRQSRSGRIERTAVRRPSRKSSAGKL